MMRSEKGVTPIISVILLLMMSVAVAGLAWFWLQSLSGSTMNATESMTKQQTQQMLTLIDIADYGLECAGTGATATVNNLELQIFNRGSTTINVNAVVVNGKTATIGTAGSNRVISPGTVGTLNVTGITAQIANFNASNSRTADLLVSTEQGYVKKTLTFEGIRCNP